jgi:hypothetical protein
MVALAALGTVLTRGQATRRVDRWYVDELAANPVARSAVEEGLLQLVSARSTHRAALEDPGQELDTVVPTIATQALLARRGGLEVVDVRVRKKDHVGKRYSSIGFLEITVRLGRRAVGAGVVPAYEFEALRYFLVVQVPGKPTELTLSKGDLLWQKRSL